MARFLRNAEEKRSVALFLQAECFDAEVTDEITSDNADITDLNTDAMMTHILECAFALNAVYRMKQKATCAMKEEERNNFKAKTLVLATALKYAILHNIEAEFSGTEATKWLS